MRRLPLAAVLVTSLALASCGGSDGASDTSDTPTDESTSTDDGVADTSAADDDRVTTTVSTIVDTVPDEVEEPAPAPDTIPAAGAVPVSLVEWAIDAPISVPSGPVSFAVSNTGDLPHHLAIARGTTYEELPLLANGAVDEATLGDDYLGRTDNVPSGGTATLDVDLEPGSYVLFCNITAGPNSHAAQGQVLSITVG